MTVENMDIDQLQLSVKKYMAYKNKLNPTDMKSLQQKYKEYIKEQFLSEMDKESNPGYRILEMIYNKL